MAQRPQIELPLFCGILPVNKSPDTTSFSLISILRRRSQIEKIGHAGTLDPFATGVMVLLIGRLYTKLSNRFLTADKQYRATIRFGETTDTYDSDGQILSTSNRVPTLSELKLALLSFQGDCTQTPPMFSAKKINGQKLYDLARKGVTIEREPMHVRLSSQLLSYEYPMAELLIDCSKGTYIRSLAYDLGKMLGCGAHLSALTRTRSGAYSLDDCVSQEQLKDSEFDFKPFLRKDL